MSDLKKININGFAIYLSERLNHFDPHAVIEVLTRPSRDSEGILGGRAQIMSIKLADDNIAIKKYVRGGVPGKFVRGTYFRFGQNRAQIEYDILERVRAQGINAPEPLGYVLHGSIFYNAWLMMREIPGHKALAQLALNDAEKAFAATDCLVESITKLVESGIYHVDLHPGNVLLDKNDRVYIIDFDRARLYRGDKNRLRDMYICRWRSAVIKYNLPDFLAERICLGLRRKFVT
ncbi:MAG: hypothetical protein D6719_01620 [Candidatus Dadabacteria bacterium]|nr:MAG: hypothetical protein D6719_01620 [Candidatus Dadabacteria bacterium]